MTAPALEAPPQTTTECIFCLIASGTVAPGGTGRLVADYDHVVMFEPLNPVTPGHLLVVPKKHVSDFMEDPGVTAYAAYFAATYAHVNMADQDANLLTSRGPFATQSVWHLHWHLVPRVEGDGLALPWSGRQQQMDAWVNGFLYGYYQDRGYPHAKATELAASSEVPWHLAEQLDYWNPYHPTETDPTEED